MITLVAAEDGIPNGLQRSICRSGSTTARSQTIYSADGGKRELERLIGSSNFCTNERITIQMGLGAVLTNEATCICTTQSELQKVGCLPGQKQPTVTTVIPRSQTTCTSDSVTVSKCWSDARKAFQEACQGEDRRIAPPQSGTPSPTPTPSPVPAPSPTPGPTPTPTSTPNPSPSPTPQPSPSPAPPGPTPEPQPVPSPNPGGGQIAQTNPIQYPSGNFFSNFYTQSPQAPRPAMALPVTPSGIPGISIHVSPAPVVSTTTKPAVQLIAQPRTLPKGGTILVSWASVGTKSCQLSQNAQTIASGIQGSAVVRTAAYAHTVYPFRLECEIQSGENLERNDTVQVYL